MHISRVTLEAIPSRARSWKSRPSPGALAGLLCAAAALACGSAAAAAPARPEADLPEVVVTARLVEEDLQKVPISVTRIDAEMLKQQGLTKVSDLMYAAPSLTINPYFNTLTNSYAIRGLAAGVTTYFSEAPCCTGSASIPMLDIESVQVLNGPQGTLFGRSSAAGAILIDPVHPDLASHGGFAEVTVGDFGRAQFTGAVNAPLIKGHLAARFAAGIVRVDGYTRAIGSDLRFDEQSSESYRLGIEFDAGRLRNYLAAAYVHLDQSATNQVLSAIYPDAAGGLYNLPAAAATAVFGGVCERAVGLGLEADVNGCVTSRYNSLVGIKAALIAEQARLAAGGDAVRFEPTPVGGQPARLRLRNLSVINVAEYALRDSGDLTLRLKDIFAYESAADVASSPADGIGGLGEQGGASATSGYGSSNQRGRFIVPRLGPDTETVSNETQVHFDVKQGFVVGAAGLFYRRSEQPASDLGTGNIYQVFGGVFNENLGYNSALGFSAGAHGKETAVYAHATADASSWVRGLKLTGGYRYSWNSTYAASRPAVADAVTGVFAPGPGVSITRTKSSGFNANVSAAEQLSDDLMAYVTVSRAYVPGGVNLFDSGQAASALPNFAPTYGPETVLSVELGAKWQFRVAGAVGRLDLAAYDYRFDDIQENFSGQANNVGFFYVANIAAAKLRGFEASATLVPSRLWEVRGSYNYNDFRYTRWTGLDPLNIAQPGDAICEPSSPAGFCFLDLTQNPSVGMPPHQGRITVVLHAPIEPRLGALDLSATLYAQARVYFQAAAHRELQILGPGALQAFSQDPYAVLNLRASWSSPFGRPFNAALFVNNATDEIYKLGTTAQVSSLGFGAAHYAPPRMVGLELSSRF